MEILRRPFAVALMLLCLAAIAIYIFFFVPIQVQNSNSIELERLVLATKPLSAMSIDEILQLISYKVSDHLYVLYGALIALALALGAWKVASQKAEEQ